LLGLRYRYENQEFDGNGTVDVAGIFTTQTFTLDATHEKLREHLYGPYTGLKLSFKPTADSSSLW
jgi:hypothetical protein